MDVEVMECVVCRRAGNFEGSALRLCAECWDTPPGRRARIEWVAVDSHPALSLEALSARLYGLEQVRAEIEAERKAAPVMSENPIQDEARALCDEWQKRLRLQDWRISVDVLRHYRMPETVCEGGTEAAHMVKHRHTKQAEITICHPDDVHPETPDKPASLEQSIIHELLHIHMDAWDPEPDCSDYWEMECAINLIADAMVALRHSA